jgi:hypothetical protein
MSCISKDSGVGRLGGSQLMRSLVRRGSPSDAPLAMKGGFRPQSHWLYGADQKGYP